MEKQIRELSEIVRGLETCNKDVLVKLRNIQTLDSQVCTCTCHNSKGGEDVSKELRAHKTRIEALEASNIELKALVQQFLREQGDQKPTTDTLSGYNNATDEYKSRRDAKDERTQGTGPGPVRTPNQGPETSVIQPTMTSHASTPQAEAAERRALSQRSVDYRTERSDSESDARKNQSTKSSSVPFHRCGNARGHKNQREGGIIQPNITTRPSAYQESNSVSSPQTHSRAGSTSSTGTESGATASADTVAEGFAVEVIHQEEVRTFAKGTDWTSVAQMELDSGQETAIKSLEGAHTCICLDISESMSKGDTWRQAKTFVLQFIHALIKVAKDHSVTDEYVSFVTFGHETRVVKRLTNKYEELLRILDSIKLGGPSPMYGGLYMALVSLIQPESWTTTVHGMTVYSKIILISDGQMTETRQQAGPDVMESKPEYSTDLFAPLKEILRRGIDMYCVPVGKANMNTMEMLSAEDGRIWPCEEGEKLGRRYFLHKAAGPGIQRGLFGPSFNPNFKSEYKLSDSDRLHMLEICNEANRRRWEEITRQREQEDVYADTSNERLLAVGSRVRRGVDWDQGDTDCDGPGTVVGHNRYADKLYVLWDGGNKIFPYQYGESGRYEVFPADDIRRPYPNGGLAVGCVVKPTDITKDKSPDIQISDRGVVVRIVPDDHKVWVKWNSGKSGTHLHLPGVIEEVSFCAPNEPSAFVPTRRESESKPKEEKRRKNKNQK